MPEREASHADGIELIRRFKADERSTADELFETYAHRLVALARARLSAKMARRFDPEDILQSVFRSFFVGLRRERWAADEIEDLWRLLAAITLNKLGEKVRFHRAAKRSNAREVASDDQSALSRDGDWLCREPSPADVVAAADELAWLLAKFSITERQAIELRLQGHSVDEIARRTGRSERTVGRWLAQARNLLESRAARFAEPRSSSFPAEPCAAAFGSSVPAPLDYRDFQLERLIDSGGMCKVYAAQQRTTNRSVCIKVMRKRQRYQRELVERFLNEARLVMQLSHPHIVPVHGLGRLPDGGYFMSMNLVEGPNLAVAQQERGANLLSGLAAIGQIAEALDYCHGQGIVHCDVQPRNILICGDGRAMLTDFGFARRVDVELSGDLSDEFVAGTPGFMAPEQFEGRATAASDVYAVGALLFWLLHGEVRSEATLNESRLSQFDHVTRVNRTDGVFSSTAVLHELSELVERCFVQDVSKRTITMREVATTIQALTSRAESM